MLKEEIYQHAGSMQQIAYVREVEYLQGRATGLRAFQVKNGQMTYSVMQDKCLDISELTYRGINMTFLSKPGLNGRNSYDTHGAEAQRSIMGGLFFTCGFENICAPYSKESCEYPMHGRMRTTPAEHAGADAYWKDDQYHIEIRGEMREAELFGENLQLRRSISTVLGTPRIIVKDEIENQGFQSMPMMLMYHCNFGFPFLTRDAKMIFPSREITPRDEISEKGVQCWNTMGSPKTGAVEEVFIHDLAADLQGNTVVGIVNEGLEMGLCIRFNKKQLPYFMQWKSTASGDYVVGLEPSNSLVYGRRYHEERGDLCMIAPQETFAVELVFEILDGKEKIQELERECMQLRESNR